VGAALAATQRRQAAGSDTGRCRGQDPSHRTRAQASAADRAQPLWERPLVAMRRWRAGDFDSSRNREQARSHKIRLRRRTGSDPCGSGLGRDAAATGRRLRYGPLSGSRPLPQNARPGFGGGSGSAPVGATFGRDAALAGRRLRFEPQSRASSLPQNSAPAANRERSSWERPWPRRSGDRPQTPIPAAVGVKTPLPNRPSSGRPHGSSTQNRAFRVSRTLRGSTGWKWRSSTPPAASPRRREV
jgi:hypothetical protein